MAVTRWRPSQGITLRDAVQQLMEDALIDTFPSGASLAGSMFPVDIRETSDGYEVDAAIPGAKVDDIEVTATGNTVVIKTEVGEHGERAARAERPGSTSRSGRSDTRARCSARSRFRARSIRAR